MIINVRRINFIVVSAMVGLFVGLRHAGAAGPSFSAKTINGGYGCAASGTALGEQLMQLTFDGKGNISGSQLLGISEVCEGSVSGTYSVSPNGMGKMTLTLSFSAQDADNDFDCKGLVNGLIENFALVIEAKGKVFDIKSMDDFLAGPPISPMDADSNSFIGSCKSQNR